MKSLGLIENETTNNKNSKNVTYLKVTEVILVHFNIANIMIINRIQQCCIYLYPMNNLVNNKKFYLQMSYF